MKDANNCPLTEYGIGDAPDGMTWIVGKVNDEQVAVLILKPADAFGARKVFQVWTDKAYRNKGVASYLWEVAKANNLNPQHDSHKTKDGEAWANAISA